MISEFGIFLRRITPTAKQQAAASSCRRGLAMVLGRRFSLHGEKIRLFGSAHKGTSIRSSTRDVDLFLTLSYGPNFVLYTRDGAARVIEEVRAALKQRYPCTPIKKWKNGVTIYFNRLTVDLMPVFKDSNGRYHLPDSDSRHWFRASYAIFEDQSCGLSSTKGFCLKLIRVIKAWNHNNGRLFKSFYLESLVFDYVKRFPKALPISTALRIFFGQLPVQLEEARKRSGFNAINSLCLFNDNKTPEMAYEIVRYAYIVSAEAVASEAADKMRASLLWRQLLGRLFPLMKSNLH